MFPVTAYGTSNNTWHSKDKEFSFIEQVAE